MSAKELFGVEKPIIARLHLRALPGDPAYNKAGGLNYIIDTAAAELRALQEKEERAEILQRLSDGEIDVDTAIEALHQLKGEK